MPLYVYRCESCSHEFEELLTAAEARSAIAVACPACGAERTERQMGTFAVRGSASRPEPSEAPFCGRCGENRPPCSAN